MEHFVSMQPSQLSLTPVDKPIMGQPHRARRITPRLLLLAVWLLSAFYMAKELRRGWLPHDDGVLAQSAERVLLGELPHRDFDELYTGGLSFLNAGAFRVFGTNLASMRYVLYLFFLSWIPFVYYIASRFGRPWVAASITLLAVAWSVPNYSTAMPSWYNLFFATFGVAAFFHFIETKRKMWLFVAGLCGGVSFLFKLSGMYYVAGSVFFLLFSEHRGKNPASRTERWACIALALSCVLAYEASVFSLLRKLFYPGSFLYFFLPTFATGTAVIWRRIQSRNQDSNIRDMLVNLLLFGAGVAAPIVLFLIPYVRAGAVADFVRGVFVLPGKRLHYTVKTQSLPRFLAGIAVDTVFVFTVFTLRGRFRKVLESLIVTVSLAVVLVASQHRTISDAAWVPIWNLLVVVVLAGVILLMAKAGDIQVEQRQKIFLLLAVTAACNLIQFPYSAPVYFCYVAPLLLLCMLAAGTLIEDPPRPLLSGLFCASLLYALVVLTPTFLYRRGELSVPKGGVADFVLPRAGGLLLYGEDARENADLVNIVKQHARGEYIYAAPDCPQVYFLSGFRNPTRAFFDFLEEQPGRSQRILAAIHARDVNLVVINLGAGFSGQVPQDLRETLETEFPERAATPNYEVLWKP